ncbi:MAG: histidine kinase dimerization/phospho-acceptor domain-containing protein, partial [Patescibacteria group bacterium]
GILTDAFHCEKIGVALLGKKKKLYIAYEQGFKAGEAKRLATGKERIMSYEFKMSGGKALVLDEMKTQYENGEYKPFSPKTLYELYEHDLAIIIPLKTKENLTGLIAVGAKKSGDPYGSQDLRILDIVAGQAAVAIENAKYVEEIKRFSETLKIEIKKATAKLEKANVELKHMDDTKSEFISIASHQLRTPLTSIKGFISMINDGDLGAVCVSI